MLQKKLAVALIPLLLLLCFSLSVHAQGANAVVAQQNASEASSNQPTLIPAALSVEASMETEEAEPAILAGSPESSSLEGLPASETGLTESIPIVTSKKKQSEMRPFSTFAIGLEVDTLGAGIEAATPLSHSLNLRTGVNVFAFGYPFTIDGINYNAEMYFRSGQLNVDWFPERRGGFHLSAGLIYLKNDLSASATVAPGQYFELGGQGFTNSIDDPISGTAKVVYPRSIAPTLMLGFSNILPRNGKHFSMPYEFGAAYTGQAHVNIQINGTACTYEGCFAAATNTELQQSLQQENEKLNNSLKSFPLYPIISLGLAYRF